jgi:uncharacterized membrane protein
MVTEIEVAPKRNLVYGIWLSVAGLLGLLAAFVLTLEKFKSITNPDEGASCDFSVIVQCSANLSSAAGSVFGFPNPLIGLMAWPMVLATALLVIFSVRIPKFWWYGFFTGVTGALIFVTWLQFQSIMILGTLCPWCMVTWFAVIPTWLATLAHTGSLGLWSSKAANFFQSLKAYVPVISLVWFAAIAIWAQLRLDWIATL